MKHQCLRNSHFLNWVVQGQHVHPTWPSPLTYPNETFKWHIYSMMENNCANLYWNPSKIIGDMVRIEGRTHRPTHINQTCNNHVLLNASGLDKKVTLMFALDRWPRHWQLTLTPKKRSYHKSFVEIERQIKIQTEWMLLKLFLMLVISQQPEHLSMISLKSFW